MQNMNRGVDDVVVHEVIPKIELSFDEVNPFLDASNERFIGNSHN